MKITVRAFARFREFFGGQFDIEVPEHARVRDAVRAIARSRPGGGEVLLDAEGDVQRSVIVLVNRARVAGESRETLRLEEGDEITIYPPVAGG